MVPATVLPVRAQGGYSLIEVVVAVALAGLVILSLATAMLTIVRTNGLNSDRQRIDAAMTSFSENVRGGEYLRCDASGPDPADYEVFDVWSPPDGVEARVIAIEFWDATADAFVPGCPTGDGGAQRLTLTTTYRDLERSAQIVVRR